MKDLELQILQDVYDSIKFLFIAKIDELNFYKENTYVIAKVIGKLRCSEMISYYCYKKIGGKEYELIDYAFSETEALKLLNLD